MSKNAFNHFIISVEEFFNQNKRDLPWRKKTPVAYEVWLSEIILQQTRVTQGTPYYEKILATYPTIKALAEAHEDELLALWTGLGYYSRARNLQKGAQQIMMEFEGELPSTSQDLLSIKGIGPYTAAAIASICFGERKGVVDGNVYRVLSRYFGIHSPINQGSGPKEFQELADELVQQAMNPGNYNQGIMDFGALHCTPKKPHCETCPLAIFCNAYQHQCIDKLPVKIRKNKRTKETIHFAVVERRGKWAMYKRDASSIWGGLYEFPRLESAPKKGVLMQDPIKHRLTHKDLHCHFWAVNEKAIGEAQKYYGKSEIESLGVPVIVSNFVKNML